MSASGKLFSNRLQADYIEMVQALLAKIPLDQQREQIADALLGIADKTPVPVHNTSSIFNCLRRKKMADENSAPVADFADRFPVATSASLAELQSAYLQPELYVQDATYFDAYRALFRDQLRRYSREIQNLTANEVQVIIQAREDKEADRNQNKSRLEKVRREGIPPHCQTRPMSTWEQFGDYRWARYRPQATYQARMAEIWAENRHIYRQNMIRTAEMLSIHLEQGFCGNARSVTGFLRYSLFSLVNCLSSMGLAQYTRERMRVEYVHAMMTPPVEPDLEAGTYFRP